MSRSLRPILSALLVAAPLAAQAQPSDVDRAARSIRVEDVRARVEALAADSLAGRATPSPGLERAAACIADAFRRAGLRPAGDSASYVQRYTFPAHTVAPAERRFRFRAGGRETAFEYGADYFAFGALNPADGAEAVFLGAAAIELPPVPASVRGKVVFYFLPGSLIEGVGMLSAALAAGLQGEAAAVVVIADPAMSADSMTWFAHQMEASGTYTPAPVAGARYEGARALFRAAGLELDSLRSRAAGGEPIPLRGVAVSIAQPARRVEVPAPNVIALLPGSDPVLRDEYVVISAHFDHVGTGRANAHGDSIFNGADDNASGTAALLEAAEAFAALPAPPARSILFLAVSGEERGLKGSVHWVGHPTVPLERVVANLNLDMVGRNARDTLVVMGQEFSSLGEVVRRVGAAHPELFAAFPSIADPRLKWFGRSDHAAFVMAGVPVLFFTTLPHPDYHRLSDEPANLDVEKLTRVSRMLLYVAHAVASDPARPTWTPTGLEEARAALQ